MKNAVLVSLGTLALVALIAIVLTFPTMWLMNYLFAPSLLLAVFGVAKIGFLRTFLFGVFVGLFTYKGSIKNSA